MQTRMPRMPYIPVEGRPPRPSMGVRPLDPADWLEVGPDRPVQMRRKYELLASRAADVVAHQPLADAACTELLGMVLANLADWHPGRHRRAAACVTDESTGHVTDLSALHPVDAAGRLVQEDLCVMVRQADRWILGAASLCFPNRWRLADKMGRSLAGVHDPVPGYPERLERATDRLLDRITADTMVWRLNWGLLDDPELFQPVPDPARARRAPLTPGQIGGGTFFRVERQTVRALPASGGVVFTIRTYVAPLEDILAEQPGLAGRLAATVRGAEPAHIAYRGWTDLREPLLSYLDAYG
ncbi:MAG: heme-dependent oxidative N-demethylase family protein [Frankia sp.]